MASGFSLKDRLFNADKVAWLAARFEQADAGFDRAGFEARVMARLPDLELKARISWIAECLDAALPGSLGDVAERLRAALPPPLDPDRRDHDFGDFIIAPLGETVVRKGLEHAPDLSLDLLEEITRRFSMEWAIRPFLNRWPDLVLERMEDWAAHPNYHVRRLVSEGTRPRLPWGEGIALAPERPLPLLDRLHGDGTRYVTRSVANHLNDIARSAPDMVIDRLEDWATRGVQERRELAWMTSHALRGLVRAGHPRALAALGYDPHAAFDCALDMRCTRVAIGGALDFTVTLRSRDETPVLVDYVIHFPGAAGRARSKVFKLKQAVVKGGELVLTKRHVMKGDATTFRLFPGAHRLEVQVNGRRCAEGGFDLVGG